MSASLLTCRGEALNSAPWQIYPRPQLRRNNYVNLNGIWGFTVREDGHLPAQYDRQILVPFCPESPLSGVNSHFAEGSSLFYCRSFSLPEEARQGRVLLHIGAADQIAEVYVNQKSVGTHAGGYDAFSFDITDFIGPENELVIRITDDLRSHILPCGKQSLHRGGMWYTPVSGIWQTVWLETVPENYVNCIDIETNLHTATVTLTPPLSGQILCCGKTYPLVRGVAVITPDQPIPWTPENPKLYPFTVTAGEDRFESYFALRTLEIRHVNGLPRLCLNGKPYFFHGLLDQGYWPDGLFTPAAPEGYADDIVAMKKLGFNMLRKHIKVEAEQFYYDCDRLGMVVFQDMVCNGEYRYIRDTVMPTFFRQVKDDRQMHPDPAARSAFLEGMEATVRQLKNHPCICCWTIFNEGWGQFDSTAVYHRLQQLDRSRFIDTTSGWFRGSESDVESLHIYFDTWLHLKRSKKPIVVSEFGGFVYGVPGHCFSPDHSYGYGTYRDPQSLNKNLNTLYRKRVIPSISKGLCASVYTQVSDVEDETNGLLTYDRKVLKVDPDIMRAIAKDIQSAMG